MAGDGAQLPEDDSQARGAQDRWGPTPPRCPGRGSRSEAWRAAVSSGQR